MGGVGVGWQALAFVGWFRRTGLPLDDAWQRWSESKDFAPGKAWAIRTAALDLLGYGEQREEAAA
jgi:hypothetical protein